MKKDPEGRYKADIPFKLPDPRIILAVFAVIILIFFASTVFYIVSPDEQGVVLRFGHMARIEEPGPHLKLPFPIETVERPKVTEVKREEIGFRTITPGPPARYADIPQESLMLTGDENIVDIDIIVQYKIADAARYLFNVRGKSKTVRDASEAALREVIGTRGIDEALTEGKFQIQEETKALLQQILNIYDAGIHIVAVQLQTVNPPKQVVDAFKDVASAREDKNRLIRQAQGYYNDIIPKTKGQAEQIIRKAEAYREEKISRAKGDANRFNAILKEYNKARDVTRKRMYIETMEETLENMEKYIVSDEASGGILRILQLYGKGTEEKK